MSTDHPGDDPDGAAATERLNRLAETLAAAGELNNRAWREAFITTPRHVFVPRYFVCDNPGGWPAHWHTVSGADPATRTEWLDTVYSDQTLITDLRKQPIPAELGGGAQLVATSSSTLPSRMLRMLHDLDVHDRMRVLEIGTGTGYNAALLSRRLGAADVASIDIDPHLIDTAGERLASCGLRPQLAAADGEQGWPTAAPYDRILATCSVDRVPPAWIDQTRPGGKIIANLRGPIMRGALALLQVARDGTATGHFLPGYTSFMTLRHDATMPPTDPASTMTDQPAHDSTSTLNPASLRDNDAWSFFAQLHLPGVRVRRTVAADGDTGTKLVGADGSWAVAWHTPENGLHPITQAGPTRLWDTIEHARQRWIELGRPSWTDFRITAAHDRQHLHLVNQPVEDSWRLVA